MQHHVDAAIARLSRGQHGVWTRRQALAVGATRGIIQARLRSGVWMVLDTAVYGHAAAPPTWERSVMAAVLAEPWAVASHRSAAVLHRFDGFRQGRPEITIRPGANARGRLSLAHRGVDVRTTAVDGIPAVTVEQAFIDVAQVVGLAKLQRALAAHVDKRLVDLDALRDRYCELVPRGGRKLRLLRAALERFGSGDLPQETELERIMRTVLTDPSIPTIEWQAPFPGRRPGKQRVDGLIPDWSLIVEGDGRAWHTRIEDFERDRRRDAEAAAAGLQTLRFTWHQLKIEPDWVRGIVVTTGAHRVAA